LLSLFGSKWLWSDASRYSQPLKTRRTILSRAKAFFTKPLSEQWHIALRYSRRTTRRIFKRVVGKLFPSISLPQRIEGGARWLATNDWVGDAIYEGVFELHERRFVWEFLQPGMVMLDIGAHHGLYTVIAATKVGRGGRVIAFEPSPRERARLETHRQKNRLDQVTIESIALGKEEGEATLYLPTERNSGFNSLRIAQTLRDEAMEVKVPLEKLDHYLARTKRPPVDLVKLDVEGGELDVLRGGSSVFGSGSERPAILCEVEDERTEPWGYEAAEIIRLVERMGYSWFLPSPGGRLVPFDTTRTRYAHNLVAVPPEKHDELRRLMVVR